MFKLISSANADGPAGWAQRKEDAEASAAAGAAWPCQKTSS